MIAMPDGSRCLKDDGDQLLCSDGSISLAGCDEENDCPDCAADCLTAYTLQAIGSVTHFRLSAFSKIGCLGDDSSDPYDDDITSIVANVFSTPVVVTRGVGCNWSGSATVSVSQSVMGGDVDITGVRLDAYLNCSGGFWQASMYATILIDDETCPEQVLYPGAWAFFLNNDCPDGGDYDLTDKLDEPIPSCFWWACLGGDYQMPSTYVGTWTGISIA